MVVAEKVVPEVNAHGPWRHGFLISRCH